jgi:hypothetical protein
MKRYEGRIAGVLGAVIIHLLVVILFFTVKLNSLKRESEREFILVFDQIMEEPEPVPDIKLPAAGGESDIDQMIRNIVRNLSNSENPVIDPQEYQDMVKEEMIRKGQLGEDNFIDDWKKRQSEEGAVEISGKTKEDQQKTTTDFKPVNYQGPTRVYYRLDNRYHTNIPIPVYKCEGAGMVSLAIEVDRAGAVVSAKISTSESTTSDNCLLETAVKAAMLSRFNPDNNALARQTGTLTFHFVAQ